MRRAALVLVSVVAAGVLVALVAGPAVAGGSDSPTPYTVDVDGITLPDGYVFADGGHVNVNTDEGAVSMHFEGKCVDRTDAECAGKRHDDAQFIGQSFIPWSAFGLPDFFCVLWVQLSQFNEHFGEGGQSPVCVGDSVPSPSPSPSVTPEPSTPPVPEVPVLAQTGVSPLGWLILAMSAVGLVCAGWALRREARDMRDELPNYKRSGS